MTLTVSLDEIVARSRDGRLADGPGWGRVRLRDIAHIQNGFAFKSANFNKERRGLPLLRIRDVGDEATEAFYEGDYEDRYLVRSGDIVVGMDGDFRAARWTGETALLNQRVARISLREGAFYDERFLLYALPGYLDAIHSFTSSVTVKHLSSRSLEDIPLPNPRLPEQQRIVAAIEEQFSRLDAAEASLSRARKGLSRMEAASLSVLGASNWPVRPLGEFLTEPPRNGHSSKAAPAGQEGVRTLTLTAVTARDFSVANTKVTVASPEKVKDLWLKPGDILIERSNTPELVGSAAMFEGDEEWAIFPDLMIRVRVGGELLPTFLNLVLRTPEARRYFRERAQGIAGSMPKISQSTVETLPVPLPPLDVQRVHVSEAERLASLISSLTASLTTAQRRLVGLRSAVLRDAFAGHLTAGGTDRDMAAELVGS